MTQRAKTKSRRGALSNSIFERAHDPAADLSLTLSFARRQHDTAG